MTRIGSFFKNTIKTISNFGRHVVKTISPHVTHGLHQFASVAPQLGDIGQKLSSAYGHPKIGQGLHKGLGIAGNVANTVGTGLHYLANGNMGMNNYKSYNNIPTTHAHIL
ncbi:MAG: hypothetical protein EOP34_03450 [Rickettsiales bacterium]|nr:MAG: hypothetical protein EOP34_03450 [Rickettsiales bacterium]